MKAVPAALFAVAGLLTLTACSPPEPMGQEAPNILLIVADDLGYADLGSFGSDIRTPNIDALAAEGVRFTNFQAGPSCAPSRAMLLTGANNHVVGMGSQNNFIAGVPGYENRITRRVAPLPRLLSEAGYLTATAGKWHLGNAPEEAPPSVGFQRSWSLINGAASHFGDRGFTAAGSTYREDGLDVSWPAGAYSTEWYTERILGYMEEARTEERPFFVYAAYTAPHWPLQLPDGWRDRYAGRYDEGYDVWRERNFENLQAAGIIEPDATLPPRNEAVRPWNELSPEEQRIEAREMELYAAMVENLDHHVGRVLDWLRANDLYERTLIVFMSDNGAAHEDFWVQGPDVEHIRATYDNAYERMGLPGSWVSYGRPWAEAGSAPFSRHKTYMRQGGIIAPMIVTGPGIGRPGELEKGWATVLDLAPTFLEAAGTRYPEDVSVAPLEGTSLLPVLGGTTAEVHGDEHVVAMYHDGRAHVRRGRWKLVTLERPFEESKFQLFDVVDDPGETTDLAGERPELYAEMLELWRSEKARLGIVTLEEIAAARDPG